MGRLAFYLPVAGFLALALLLWRGLFLDPKELPSMLIDKPMPQFQLRTVDGESCHQRQSARANFSPQRLGQLLSAMPCGAPYFHASF